MTKELNCEYLCPLAALCAFRKQEAAWLDDRKNTELKAAMAPLIGSATELNAEQLDKVIEGVARTVVAIEVHYGEVQDPEYFEKLRQEALDNCYTGPHETRQYLLFGSKAMRCTSLARLEIESGLAGLASQNIIPPPRHSSPE